MIIDITKSSFDLNNSNPEYFDTLDDNFLYECMNGEKFKNILIKHLHKMCSFKFKQILHVEKNVVWNVKVHVTN